MSQGVACQTLAICWMQELRGKLANCQNQQAEMLRRAQDICLSAEDRAEKAEARLEKVQAQAARLEAELRESRAEAKRLINELKVLLLMLHALLLAELWTVTRSVALELASSSFKPVQSCIDSA